MSVVDVAKALRDLGVPCERVTMDLTGTPRVTQLFKFYVTGREQPVEVSYVGNATPAQLAAIALRNLSTN